MHPDTQPQFTPQEIEDAEKEMHMKGRAMRVDENIQQYNDERRRTWAEKIKTQQAKDNQDIQIVRKKIDGMIQERELPDSENYDKLANVALGKQELQTTLDQFSNGKKTEEELVRRAQKIIYEMLTTRSDFVKSKQQVGGDLTKLMERYKPQQEWYRKTRQELEKFADGGGVFKWDSNPGWFGINTRPEVPKRDDINIKTYTTVPVAEYAFIQRIPQLANELRQLSLDSDDIIQVKIPESMTAFMAHPDSVVVHFKNKENVPKILEIIDNWTKQNNITEVPREMGRTRIAADAKDKSFSELVAENIAAWIKENAGKYDNKLLVEQAAKHAIEQSQKSPI